MHVYSLKDLTQSVVKVWLFKVNNHNNQSNLQFLTKVNGDYSHDSMSSCVAGLAIKPTKTETSTNQALCKGYDDWSTLSCVQYNTTPLAVLRCRLLTN